MSEYDCDVSGPGVVIIPGLPPGHHMRADPRGQPSVPQPANNPPILRNLIIHGMFKPSHDGCLTRAAVTRFIGFSLNVFEAELGI